ncbi:DUF5011 domain-containing protein [Listeria booriae]|uniref:LPXTG cell wall anchor domain-containing protein n=1 Tax=Listeria booriae TaxID=1552123 RepID=UPI001627DE7B|nr:immunoglobulin-like domain-containing protein [Listeria booriae]MBC2316571.1 DUF5011 domain-containing protein [Listeria booriae]
MNQKIIKLATGTIIVSAIFGGTNNLPYNVVKEPIVQAATTNLQGVPKPPIEVISIQNGSFEQPAIATGSTILSEDTVPGWKTTATDHLIEIQNHYEGQEAADGNQYAELNAYENSALYQDIPTTPGAKVRWQVAHKGRQGVDVAVVKFGAPGSLQTIQTMSTGMDNWKTYSGTYTIPAGQTTTRFEFEAVSSSTGDVTRGNYLDNIIFSTQSFITVSGNVDETSVKKDQSTTYSFDAKNEGGMASQNTILTIPIPQEVTLASPVVKVDGGSVTGSYNSDTHTLSIPLGNISKAAVKHVTFDVTGTTIANNITTQATVTHQDNGYTDEQYTNYSNNVSLNVIANNAPTITAADQSLKKGVKFDPMSGVSAADSEDGNLSSIVKITANDVDTSQEGTYHVTYSVTDSDGNTTTKQITVTVTSNDAPTIEATDHTLKKGTKFDPMSEVSAADKEDGDMTKEIKITANDVDTSQEGTYHVTYSVTDSDDNTTTKEITVTVTSNDAPTIEATDHTLKKGNEFDPMSEVSATDKEDGNLTKDIKITANDVDTTQEGIYHVTYSITDSDENTTTKEITVTVTSNDAPTITATDKTLKRGDTFDALAEVSAADKEDGDLTSDIQVIANDVNPDQEGTYSVTYSVTDSDNNTTTKQINVTVTSNELPVITATDHTIKKGSNFDPMSEVSATDQEDGDLTNVIKITANNVNTNKEGIYQITYSVTDSDDNTTTKDVTVIVTSNEKPAIQAEDQTIKKGTKFDPIADVTATDQEDGDLTKTIEVIRNTVDTTKEGTYQVSYEVIDSDGNIAYKTITVTVTSNEKPTIAAEDQVITVGDKFDPQQLATSTDQEDGDLTKQIEVISNTVDTSQPGTYKVVYRVTDSDNNTVEKTITVTVLPKAAGITPPPATPEITPVAPAKTSIITPVEHITSIITPDTTPIVTQTSPELPTTGDQSSKTPILLGGALISLAYFLFRRKK